MTSQIFRSISEPIREGLSARKLWLSEDDGLIKCWELGREWSKSKPELATAAARGELPAMNWKGGVEKKLKKPLKYGTFRYLATWQGLREEDLDIDVTVETEVTCSRTGVRVIYTPDLSKYNADE